MASRRDVFPEPLPPQMSVSPGGISRLTSSMQRRLRMSSARRLTDLEDLCHAGRKSLLPPARICGGGSDIARLTEAGFHPRPLASWFHVERSGSSRPLPHRAPRMGVLTVGHWRTPELGGDCRGTRAVDRRLRLPAPCAVAPAEIRQDPLVRCPSNPG